ncbi:uncharacterized protein LOC121397801 isoform X2 [Xenopus laevis]|uniref:Uncharacterized protein LOC121397801 isoform X2 n=1 Tax=Xenopus laevis TaxID=8355 RepID=A0A8J1LP66_XENLA|nr:uncharacterized protein LOC121397801 isoform X2 [Xenopus laevis]
MPSEISPSCILSSNYSFVSWRRRVNKSVMAYSISIQIIISILLNYFINFAVGFPVWRLDGPSDQKADCTTSDSMKQLVLEIPKPYIRLAGACISLLIIGLLALSIRFCNKHVKELKKREEEVRSLQVVEPGVKIHIGEEGNSKENEVTPNKENNNKVGEIPESATITDVPQENCAETDKEIKDVESQHMNEDTTKKQKKKNWRKYLPFTKKTNPPPENGVETDKELKESGKKRLKLLKRLKLVKQRKPELSEETDEQNKKVDETQVEEVDQKKKKRKWKWKWKKKRAEMTLLPL